jgi:hypothetical protein
MSLSRRQHSVNNTGSSQVSPLRFMDTTEMQVVDCLALSGNIVFEVLEALWYHP